MTFKLNIEAGNTHEMILVYAFARFFYNYLLCRCT